MHLLYSDMAIAVIQGLRWCWWAWPHFRRGFALLSQWRANHGSTVFIWVSQAASAGISFEEPELSNNLMYFVGTLSQLEAVTKSWPKINLWTDLGPSAILAGSKEDLGLSHLYILWCLHLGTCWCPILYSWRHDIFESSIWAYLVMQASACIWSSKGSGHWELQGLWFLCLPGVILVVFPYFWSAGP